MHKNPRHITLCPTLALTRMWLLYTCKDVSNRTYRDDAEWFSHHRKRSHVIRKAARDEFGDFDAALSVRGRFVMPPQLYVSVTRTSGGHHLVLPIWRGTAAWPCDSSTSSYCTVDSDDATRLLFDQMNQAGGVNLQELAEWAMLLSEAIRAQDEQQTSGIVH